MESRKREKVREGERERKQERGKRRERKKEKAVGGLARKITDLIIGLSRGI